MAVFFVNLCGNSFVLYKRPLNDKQIRRLRKPGRYTVGGVHGLMLYVQSPQARSWVLRVMVGERRRDIGLGGYPSVELHSARARARAMCDQVWAGADPVAERRRTRTAQTAPAVVTFEEATRKCHAAKSAEFRSTKHAEYWLSSLERFAFDLIGSVPVTDIQEPHVLRVLEPIWNEKTDTATRVRQRIETVLSWAKVNRLRSGDNPARWQGNLEHTLARPSKIHKVTHRRALPWADVPAFMSELRRREGYGSRALEFAVLTLARSREVRLAPWTEIDLDKGLWDIPAERMKADKRHTVPLAPQSLRLLESVARMPESPYIFPAARGGPLSDVTLIASCRRIGVDATPHGFRSSFKDWARAATTFPDEVSELALAHVNSDATRAAYARDGLLDKRREMLEQWAVFCYGGTRP